MKIDGILFLSSLAALSSSISATNAHESHNSEEILASLGALNGKASKTNSQSLRADKNDFHERVLNDVVSENNPEPDDSQENKDRKMGERCTRWNECREGLDCVDSGAAFIKICLPMNCVEQVVNNYNDEYMSEDGEGLYNQFARQVLQGAHSILPEIPVNASFTDMDIFLNDSMKEYSLAAASNPQNFMHVLRSDVRNAFETSLKRVQKKDPLNIKNLNAKIQECFEPFIGNASGAGHGRGLQEETISLTIPGFFFELGALFQFLYAFGVIDDPEDNVTDIIVHDICFGGGPAVGAGLGFLLQIWWIPDPSNAPSNVLTDAILGGDTSQLQEKAPVFLPFPSIMLELDAALGPGFGLAYNTFAFLCHRLWLKFFLGAGGGLTFSLCFVGLDGDDIISDSNRKLIEGEEKAKIGDKRDDK